MHRIPTLAAALALLLALPSGTAAGEGTPAGVGAALPANMLVDTLPNGLEIVVEERHDVPIARVHAYMRVGALYEGEYLGSGLSHYMEHIVAGGTTRRKETGPDGALRWVGRTEEENKALLKSIGGNSNAQTSYDHTAYYITTKSEMLETAVDLISGYLQHCQFDPDEVAREQRVVQQELLRNLDDANRERALLFTETMFKVHPVRVPVIGYQDCIQRITREDMLRFYQRHYTPQNCVVAVVGDVDRFAVRDLLAKHFGGWKRKSLEPYQIPQEPPQSGPRWVEREHGSTRTCLVAMGVPTIPLQHPDLYALDLLANVLGLGDAARLPAKFENDPAREVVATGLGTASLTPVYGAGRFACYFSTDTVENSRRLVEEIWAEMVRLKEELVAPEEIVRALKVLEKYHWMGRATVDDRAGDLAANQAWLSDPLHGDRYLAGIRQVTPEAVREAARKYLDRERLSVVIVTPPRPAGAAVARDTREATGDVRKVVLDNGLTVLLKRVPGYGMVDAVTTLNGGVIHEDETTNGLFFLMAGLLARGTTSRPLPALMSEMDRLGMEVGAESQNNAWTVKMKCLAADLEPALDLYADVLLRPAFDARVVEQAKRMLLTRVLPNLEVRADEMMQKVVRSRLYVRHPYRMQRFGTPQTIAGFTPERLHELHRTFARPNNAVLALYGDVDLDAAEALVRKAFGAWERGDVPTSGAVEEPPPAEPVVVELENQQVRTNYRVAWRALSRQQESERLAMSVMGTILGASGWLHARLREGKSDYVYAVSAAPYTGDRAGHFAIDTDFSPQDEAAVLAIIDGAVEDMKAGRFTDEELTLAKRMILCYDALGKRENADVAAGDGLSELFGQGWDYDVRFYEGIRAVTREDVVRVANLIFGTPPLRVFVRPAGGAAKAAPGS